MSKGLETIVILFLLIAGLPLLIYPFVLFANIMSFASGSQATHGTLTTVFLWASTLYPIPFFVSVGLCYFFRKRNRHVGAMVFSCIPIFYLALLIALYTNWAE